MDAPRENPLLFLDMVKRREKVSTDWVRHLSGEEEQDRGLPSERGNVFLPCHVLHLLELLLVVANLESSFI